jgi:prophage regulatory protein
MQKVLRRPDVESLTGLSRSSIYEMMAADTFPKPVRLSVRSVGWLETEVAAWLERRVKARDAKRAA